MLARLLFVSVLFLLTGPSHAQTENVSALAPQENYAPGTEPITRAQYQEDFEFLVAELEARHPAPFAHLAKEDFQAQLDALLERVEHQSPYTNMMDLRVIVAGLGDSHTSVGFYDAIFERGAFPMEFAWFGDDLRVIGAEDRYRDLLGARLDAINDTGFATIRQNMETLVPPNDPGFARKRVPWMMRYIGLHDYFGTTSGSSATLTFTDTSGETRSLAVDASVFDGEEGDLIYLSDEIDHPTWINFNQDRLDVMFRDIQYPDGVYLVQYNSSWGRELEARYGDPEEAEAYPSFDEFAGRILGTLQDHEVSALIFDVRANSGGSSPQGTWLAEQIAQLPEDDRPDQVFVALGEQTFSAAIINSMDFRNLLDATFIGTTSGGKANHFGEVRMFVLPNSGIELPHSTRYFEYIEGEGGNIVPDIYSPERIEDLLAGRDAVVEYVRASVSAN